MEREIIQVGALSTNCYLLYPQPKKAIVIDPGGSFNKIFECLRLHNVEEISVLLTHAHFDHIGAVDDLIKNFNAKVFINKKDELSLNNEYNLAKTFGMRPLPIINADVAFEDDAVLNIFNVEIRTIHTPGHTQGSVCYIIDDELYSGDTLFLNSHGRTDLLGGDGILMRNSLKKLFSLGKNYRVYPGHGGSTELFFEKEFNEWYLL